MNGMSGCREFSTTRKARDPPRHTGVMTRDRTASAAGPSRSISDPTRTSSGAPLRALAEAPAARSPGSAACPARLPVSAWASRSLGDAESEALEAHLLVCDRCFAVLVAAVVSRD
jgi:hypothetical protein